MSCECFESALKAGLNALEGAVVCADHIYADQKQCGDDTKAYVVFKTDVLPGLRTSSGTQKIRRVQISGYFSDKSTAKLWKSLLEIWLYSYGCVSLGDCGCLCLTTPPSVLLVPAAKDKWQVNASFSGVEHLESGES